MDRITNEQPSENQRVEPHQATPKFVPALFFEKAHRFLFAAMLGVFLCLPAFSDLWQDYWIFKALCFFTVGFFALISLCFWLFSGRFFNKNHTVSGVFILCAAYSGIAMGLLELFARFDRDLQSFMPGSRATIPLLLFLPASGLLLLIGIAYLLFRRGQAIKVKGI